MRVAAPARPCPRCGSPDAICIAYGFSGPELWEAAERGEIRLGGCMTGPESPDFECLGCGAALPWVALEM